MRGVQLLALIAMLFAAGGAAAANIPGTTRVTLTIAGDARSFLVHVGTNAAPDSPAPVVFMFHGVSRDGARIMAMSGWNRVADREGFIAVYPDALPYCLLFDWNGDGDFADQGEARVATYWSSGLHFPRAVTMPCPDGLPTPLPRVGDRPAEGDDLAFVDAIVANLEANFVVDPHRIFAAGFSNGAQMASRIAFERGDVFAAVGAHAGSLGPNPPPGRPVPFVVTYGSQDPFATFLGGVSELPTTPEVLSLLRSQVDTTLAQFGLADTFAAQTAMAGDRTIAAFTFDTAAGGGPAAAPFVFAVFGGLGHAYPDGSNYPIALADYLWTFFRDHPLP